MHPGELSIHDFSYHLPEERIARFPLTERDASKLLIYNSGKISENIFANIASHIPAGSLLVFNDTKVVAARLLFQKPSGGIIEIFCLEPAEERQDITSAMQQKTKARWKCLIGGASKWKPGQVLQKRSRDGEKDIYLQAMYISKQEDSFIIELSWEPSSFSFAEILHCTGAIPLPPYIKRKAEEADRTRYQTIYADTEGSVAAPTAGLHFTEKVFDTLRQHQIDTTYITLHVGAGTFKPVKAEKMSMHEMHAEWIRIDRGLIQTILHHTTKNIIAVGTTSLRTLETIYWLGVKTVLNGAPPGSEGLAQWEPYELEEKNIPVTEALAALLQWMNQQQTDRLLTRTSIIIAPGYTIKLPGALITNFHQPASTLLLLVAAITGNDWKLIYEYALDHGFRFLSYGDGSLLWIRQQV